MAAPTAAPATKPSHGESKVAEQAKAAMAASRMEPSRDRLMMPAFSVRVSPRVASTRGAPAISMAARVRAKVSI